MFRFCLLNCFVFGKNPKQGFSKLYPIIIIGSGRMLIFPIIITKQNAQVILPGVNNSGDIDNIVFNLIQSNVITAQQYSQICLKTCQCLNRGALFRETSKRF